MSFQLFFLLVSKLYIQWLWYGTVWYVMLWYGMVWYGMVWYGMVAFLYTEGIKLKAAHSGGRCSDLYQDKVQQIWHYDFNSQGQHFNEFSFRAC